MTEDKIMKKVRLLDQCAATITFPSGLWAFKKIKKLQMGIVVYFVSTVMYLFITGIFLDMIYLSTHDPSSMFGEQTDYIMIYNLPMIFLPPIIFMYKWSKDWNKKIDKQNMQPSSIL